MERIIQREIKHIGDVHKRLQAIYLIMQLDMIEYGKDLRKKREAFSAEIEPALPCDGGAVLCCDEAVL